MLRIDAEKKKRTVAQLQAHFLDERDEEIGNLGAEMIIDLVLKSLGPCIYNNAIEDAQKHMQERVLDMNDVLFEPEDRE